MSVVPCVLGLEVDEAQRRLAEAGFEPVNVAFSGRKKVGRPRVTRQIAKDGSVELIVSYFRELDRAGQSGS